MNLLVKRACVRREAIALSRLDKKIFGPDAFTPSMWRGNRCYWLMLDGRTVGSMALELNRDEVDKSAPGCLYIDSTGIVPQFQNRGLGLFAKAWQITFARMHGFKRMVMHCRKSNARIIGLNKKFGFRVIGGERKFYKHPSEDAVIMERRLRRRTHPAA